MAADAQIVSIPAGSVLARMGEPAAKFFVLLSGELQSKLPPEEKRADDEATRAADTMESWSKPQTILAAESVMVGHYIESIVAATDAQVMMLPVDRGGLIKLFAMVPKAALSFGRSLARKVVAANGNLSSSQRASARLESDLEKFYKDFYAIVNGIQKDAEGDELVLDAIKGARASKAFSVGQRLNGETAENAGEMTRVVEAYEMTGQQHKVKKGEALCRSGDPGNSMFIVSKGKLRVVIDGNKVGEINQGETVGEIAVLLGGDQKRTADLIAEENTVVAIFPGDQFEKLVQIQPPLLFQVLGILTKRIEANYATIADADTKETKALNRYLFKPGQDVEKDYRELAEAVDNLIEEYDITSLLQQFDKLDRGADKIATLKDRYAHMAPQDAA